MRGKVQTFLLLLTGQVKVTRRQREAYQTHIANMLAEKNRDTVFFVEYSLVYRRPLGPNETTYWGRDDLESMVTDKLKINLRYCYGIGKLEAELEFKHKGFAIYAPNGVDLPLIFSSTWS